ncbi:hypothetical protein [Nocardioides sp. KR10-350]|uniref:hypothetical protein n=1 Tax=Nocardioides cheoyonin TaxID=3156615 RepID=UPI0032B40F3A
MLNNPSDANRVAQTLGTLKWIVIGLIGLVAVIGAIAMFAQGGAAAASGLVFLIGGALYCLMFWVMFGWLEHTLRMLVNISANTAPAGAGFSGPTPPSYGAPGTPPSYGTPPPYQG